MIPGLIPYLLGLWILIPPPLFTAYGFLSHSPAKYLRTPRSYDLLKPPESYFEACARSDAMVWSAAMDHEMESLHSHQVFEPADLPKGRKAIGVRWVYAFKYNPDGSIIHGKEKAQLVAQGFSQRPEDFDETYAPIAKMTSIHIILAFAAINALEIMASDVKTAFLHCRLHSDIYCRGPSNPWSTSFTRARQSPTYSGCSIWLTTIRIQILYAACTFIPGPGSPALRRRPCGFLWHLGCSP